MDGALLDRIRSHLSEVRVPGNYDKVYKDECMYCFASPESTNGIFVNMKNWHGVGSRFLELDHQRTGVSLYYNEEHQRIPVPEEAAEAQEAAPTKMAIGGDQGFQVNKKRYEIAKVSRLVVMPDKMSVQLPCSELPELILQAISGIQGNEGTSQQEQTSTWEEERRESKYARNLEQLPPERKISPNPSDWECEFTGVKDNLWLNLSTGKIGSGRRHWDGSGGNGAALKHYEQTGNKYPLVVKLGTITPHSADVYSYAPDENDMVIDPLLKEHLEHWGINMMQMEKTDKTMAELQIDMNIKFEYNAITEGGSELKPVMGPGKVGINNLGNYCYMSSILQALWAIPAFGHTFTGPDRKNVLANAPGDILDDFPAQFAKVGSALVSGETDKVPYIPEDAPEQVKLEANVEANSVPPRRFKALVGKGHPEFSTGHQQDACEFYIHLMQLLERAERKSGDRMRASEDAPPLSSIFKFKLEQRTQCAATGAVSYKDEEQNVLHLDIPLEAATNSQEVAEHAAREQKRKEMKEQQAQAYIGAAGGESVVAEETEDPVVPIVPFDACLEKFAAEATLSDYYSPALGAKGRATVTHRLASFPPYLMVHLQKYFVDETWRPRKMEVLTDMQHTINLERLRALGPQPDERLQPKEPEPPSEAAGVAKEPVPDAEIVSSLTSAGFGENACKRAAVAVGNSDAESAMNWLLSHMEDADINDPLPTGGAVGAAPAAGAVDPGSVGMLSAMGFTERQAKAALKSCNGNVERAADWLFTRTDDLDAAVAAVENEAAEPEASTTAPKEMLDGPGKYELVAIVSHIGSNIACGHYVAHVKKDGLWYIFNDEKRLWPWTRFQGIETKYRPVGGQLLFRVG